MSIYFPLSVLAGEIEIESFVFVSVILGLGLLHLVLLFKNGNKNNLKEFGSFDVNEKYPLNADYKETNIKDDFNDNLGVSSELSSDISTTSSPLGNTQVKEDWKESKEQKINDGSTVSISGDEDVDQMIGKVINASKPSAIVVLIAMTTQFSRPATFAVFCYRLKTEHPVIFSKGQTVLLEALFKIPSSFTLKEKLNLRLKVIRVMRHNNLETMAGLLESGNKETFNDNRIKIECDQLKAQFDLQRGPAIESLNRFIIAKAICNSYSDKTAEHQMNNYVCVYKKYLSNYITE